MLKPSHMCLKTLGESVDLVLDECTAKLGEALSRETQLPQLTDPSPMLIC